MHITYPIPRGLMPDRLQNFCLSFGFVETAGYHLGESVVDAGAALKDDFTINSIDLMIENLSKHKT